jgi:hypothetical protein
MWVCCCVCGTLTNMCTSQHACKSIHTCTPCKAFQTSHRKTQAWTPARRTLCACVANSCSACCSGAHQSRTARRMPTLAEPCRSTVALSTALFEAPNHQTCVNRDSRRAAVMMSLRRSLPVESSFSSRTGVLSQQHGSAIDDTITTPFNENSNTNPPPVTLLKAP